MPISSESKCSRIVAAHVNDDVVPRSYYILHIKIKNRRIEISACIHGTKAFYIIFLKQLFKVSRSEIGIDYICVHDRNAAEPAEMHCHIHGKICLSHAVMSRKDSYFSEAVIHNFSSG